MCNINGYRATKFAFFLNLLLVVTCLGDQGGASPKVVKRATEKAAMKYILEHNFGPVRDFMKPNSGDTIQGVSRWTNEGLCITFYLVQKRLAVLYDLGKAKLGQYQVVNNGFGEMHPDGSWELNHTDSLGNEFSSNGGLWTLGRIRYLMGLGLKVKKSIILVYLSENNAIDGMNKKFIALGYDADGGRELERSILDELHLTRRLLNDRNQSIESETGSPGKIVFRFYGFLDSMQQDSIINLLKRTKSTVKMQLIGIEFYTAISFTKMWYGLRRDESVLIKRLIIN